jgi:biopolymer transport protein ExbD
MNRRLIALSVFFCAILLYLASTYWINSRHYDLLESPISLQRGHVQRSLQVNGSGNYQISLGVWPDQPTPVRTDWTVTRDGKVIAGGSKEVLLGKETFVGAVELRSGTYTLDFNVLTDAHQLDSILSVNADGYTYNSASDLYQSLVIVSFGIACVGLSVFLFPLPPKSEQRQPFNGPELAPPERVKRFPGIGRRIGLPTYGLTAGLLLAALMMPLYLLNIRDSSKGLRVHLVPSAAAPETACSRAIAVQVIATAPRERSTKTAPWTYQKHLTERLRIDGEEVTASTFQSRLAALLADRADRTVCVSGENDVSFEAVTSAIDMATGAHSSRIVLVTTSEK